MINSEEAKLIRRIFDLYLRRGCVSALKRQLDQDGIRSKLRIAASGRRRGGVSYSRGALYQILKNRIYLGEISHRGQNHPGQHESIVSRQIWNQVQKKLSGCHQGRRNGLAATAPSLLQGLIHDADGARFTPSHAVKNGRRYRYYVSQSVIRNPGEPHSGAVRLPAFEIEQHILLRLCDFLGSQKEIFDQLCEEADSPSVAQRLLNSAERIAQSLNSLPPVERRAFVQRVVKSVLIHDDKVELWIRRRELRALLFEKSASRSSRPPTRNVGSNNEPICLEIPSRLLQRRCGTKLIVSANCRGLVPPKVIPSLVKAVARAYGWYEQIVQGRLQNQRSITKRTGLDECYVRRILRCAFLAPDIVEAILDGRQPPGLTLEALRKDISMDWEDQRKLFGFSEKPQCH